MQKSVMTVALVAGAGALGAAGLMSMQRMYGVDQPIRLVGSSGKGHRGKMSGRMGRSMGHAADEFADELCMMAHRTGNAMMAHRTGNAMIRTGRMINRLVP